MVNRQVNSSPSYDNRQHYIIPGVRYIDFFSEQLIYLISSVVFFTD